MTCHGEVRDQYGVTCHGEKEGCMGNEILWEITSLIRLANTVLGCQDTCIAGIL